MATSTSRQSHLLRATGVGCLLVFLLVLQFAVLYLQMYLHQHVTSRSLPGFVPIIVLGGFTVILLVLGAVAWRRERPAGLLIGAGLVLLALAPFLTRVGGCEVGGASVSSTSLPQIIRRGVYIGWMTADGACHVYLNGILLVVGYLFMMAGLWTTSMTDKAIRWFRQMLDSY